MNLHIALGNEQCAGYTVHMWIYFCAWELWTSFETEPDNSAQNRVKIACKQIYFVIVFEQLERLFNLIPSYHNIRIHKYSINGQNLRHNDSCSFILSLFRLVCYLFNNEHHRNNAIWFPLNSAIALSYSMACASPYICPLIIFQIQIIYRVCKFQIIHRKSKIYRRFWK